MRDDVVAQAEVAGPAVLDAVTGEAAVAVVGEDERHHLLPHLDHGFSLGADGHAVLDQGGAGEREAAHAFDLDNAGAAPGVGREPVDVAEVGEVEAEFLDDLHQGAPRFDVELLTVDADGDHGPRR